MLAVVVWAKASVPPKKARAKSHGGASVDDLLQVLLKWLPLARLGEIRSTHPGGSLFVGDVHDVAAKYKGLHITPVLSKIAERIIKIPIGNYLESTDAFGSSQWAFRKRHGCTDLQLAERIPTAAEGRCIP